MDRDAEGLSIERVDEVQPMSEFFSPKIQSVSALAPYRLLTSWSTGEILEVDIAHVMDKPAFAEISKPDVFAKVRTDGLSIEWFDTELGPDNVYAWAKEQANEVSQKIWALGCCVISCHSLAQRTPWESAAGWSATTEPRASLFPEPFGLPAWDGRSPDQT